MSSCDAGENVDVAMPTTSDDIEEAELATAAAASNPEDDEEFRECMKYMLVCRHTCLEQCHSDVIQFNRTAAAGSAF